MKKRFFSLVLILAFSVLNAGAQESTTSAGEDYKTYNPDIRFTAGASGGFGKVNTQEGLALIGNAGARILREGFVPDIVNPVYVEAQFGPLFSEGESLWMWSTHLRWDFVKNNTWTFFALGGVGGNFYDNAKFGEDFDLHPRFGVGTFWALDLFDVRAEVSHELLTAGVSFPF